VQFHVPRRGKLILTTAVTIRDFFIQLPKAYTIELKKEKRSKTYAHIYENYSGAGQSVYQGLSCTEVVMGINPTDSIKHMIIILIYKKLLLKAMQQ